MGYTKTTWVDGTTPAINATNLNNIEDGIARVSVSSTTDNTLPRFHSTNGTLQTSGVVVDDNNNVSGIGTDLTLTATPGSYGGISYGGGTSRRWYVGKNNATESGSAAGSQFIIWAYDDSGSQTHKPFTIYRENGKVALSVTGGSAGVEISVGGPRKMVGTGSPESSVTAPAGSIWIQTDHASLTYCKWVKLSGTGNTGWYPDFEGRWITYSGFSVSSSGTQPSGWTNTARYTQTGKTISMFFRSVASASVGTGTYRLGLPVTAATTDQPVLESSLWLQGGSQCSSLYIVWIPSGGSGSYAQVVAATGSSTYGSAVDWGAATPFTWANTYELRGSFTYEAA